MREKYVLHCYIGLKLLISLNKSLLQICYMVLQGVTKGFPSRAHKKVFSKTCFR
mgnify:FL=1